MEQNEKARYKKWFPFTTYDLDELNNRDMVSNEVIEKSLLLTSSNPSRLTGSVAAATVLTILEMGMERGSFLLSKSKINLEVMKKLLNIGTEIRVSIRDNIGSDEIEGEI